MEAYILKNNGKCTNKELKLLQKLCGKDSEIDNEYKLGVVIKIESQADGEFLAMRLRVKLPRNQYHVTISEDRQSLLHIDL